METIKRSTLSEKILDAILNMIAEKGLEVGEKLPTEMEFAEGLGVGRNSVREAMKTLRLLGVIRQIPGKGTFLAQEPAVFSRESMETLGALGAFSVHDLLEARRMIETEAAFLAATADKSGAEWEAFEERFQALIRAFDTKAENTSEFDFAFHVQLVRLSGNQFLSKMLYAIVNDIKRSKKWITIDFTNIETENKLHTAAYEAICRGDATAARAAMTAHFDNTFAYCRKIGLF